MKWQEYSGGFATPLTGRLDADPIDLFRGGPFVEGARAFWPHYPRLMSERGPLGFPPAIDVEWLADHPADANGFLRLRHVELVNRYADGQRSQPYRYSMIERRLLDAVVIVLFRRCRAEVEIVLRSQLRPPLTFRDRYEVPLPATGTGAVQWELPAGLVEPGERGEAGLFLRASAEVLEEVGFQLAPSRFASLGLPTSLSPGLIAEKLHFVCAEVHDHDQAQEPAGDGHAVEERSISRFISLPEAWRAVEAGLIHDVKTELGLMRLERHLGARG